MTYDFAVVGAGIVGLATTRELRARCPGVGPAIQCPGLTAADLPLCTAGIRAEAVLSDGMLVRDFLSRSTDSPCTCARHLTGGHLGAAHRRADPAEVSDATVPAFSPRRSDSYPILNK